jgi:nitrogenase molybdenum-iron protein beta chain
MSNYIEYNRNGCLLQGAISTLKAINGVVPIIHSTPGCGIQEKYLANTLNAYNDNYTISSTNIFEKQVIFGGTARLREQIKNTVKVLDGNLYVVVSGCAAEIVGDDIGAMTKEATEQGYPVIHISTPGFKGNNFSAYKRVVIGIIEELWKKEKEEKTELEKEEDLVNVFGLAPNFDPYWEGNLEELDRLFAKVGLRLNHLFGQKSSIDQWKKIKSAKLNIAISNYGLEIVEYLNKKYGTPYLYVKEVPIGITGVEDLLDQLQTIYEDKQAVIDTVKKEEKENYLYYLSKLTPYYYRYHIQKKVTLVGVSQIVTALGKFLERRFGQIVHLIVITDHLQEHEKTQLENEFHSDTKVYFTEDGKEIEAIIKGAATEIILGSQLEENVARELQLPFLPISLPMNKKVILKKSLLGVTGSLSFLEEYSNALIEA